MEKRFQTIDGVIVVSVIIVLTPSEQERLEHADLRDKIDNIAEDMHIGWAVEQSDNIATAVISRTYGPIVGNKESHELEIQATNFMREVNNLELPKHPTVDSANNDRRRFIAKSGNLEDILQDDYKFIKMLVDDWDETEERAQTTGFVITAELMHGINAPIGRIRQGLAKELCLSYLKVHANDK